jgi:hypothetical protein
MFSSSVGSVTLKISVFMYYYTNVALAMICVHIGQFAYENYLNDSAVFLTKKKKP